MLDFPAYRTWWPWLSSFAPPPLEPGASTRAEVRAPAGYRLRLELTLAEVAAPHHVLITVGGDVLGHSTVAVSGADDHSTQVTLAWSLAPRRPLLRALNRVARPVLVRGHDRILDEGLRRCIDATGLDLVESHP